MHCTALLYKNGCGTDRGRSCSTARASSEVVEVKGNQGRDGPAETPRHSFQAPRWRLCPFLPLSSDRLAASSASRILRPAQSRYTYPFRSSDDPSLYFDRLLRPAYCMPENDMATPIIIGVGAIAAALGGRHLLKRGLLGGKGAAEQWAKGGFKAKMDRAEAISILGLKCVTAACVPAF